MAIRLIDRYPGRANPASDEYPQGSVKNKTSLDLNDGTPLEKDWANDKEAFFQGLLQSAGVTPSGAVDTVQNSDYLDSLIILEDSAASSAISTHVALSDPHSQYAKLAGETSITGTATFTNSTNNIALPNIGSIGLEIGDVVQVTGTASNNKLFSVGVITDSGNVVVNVDHEAQGTIKSLVNETVTATITLISKWFNAPIGLGQGWAGVAGQRAASTTYTNNKGRPLKVNIQLTPGGAGSRILSVDGVGVSRFSVDGASSTTFYLETIVPPGSTYSVDGSFTSWWELS